MPVVLTLVVLLSLVTYRVTRFFLTDSLIEEPRARLHGWLTAPRSWMANATVGALKLKAYELLTCPFCFSVWVAAGATIVANWYIDFPLPIFMWLAVCSGSLIVWRWIES